MSAQRAQARTTDWGPDAAARARTLLERARWAADEFASFDRAQVDRIVRAVAQAGHDNAARYAEWAVRETGFGVVADKTTKNQACSLGLLARYGDEDHVSARYDADAKILEIPRPAGVVVALTPSTNPISTVYFKVMLALMTRNAIVISPHPAAKAASADAARTLHAAAVAAGAPADVVQVVDEPTIPLVDALITDPGCGVVLATGGTPMVRAAYGSGNPALGVGPGNVPVLVDATADVVAAAKRIVASKAFDNSVLCTNESVLLAEDSIAADLLRALDDAGAHVCDPVERDRLRAWLYPEGRLRTAAIGRDAAWIAEQAGFRIRPGKRVLVAPFERPFEEPLTQEKLCPVLGFHTVADATRGIRLARLLLRWGGRGHSAAIHSRDRAAIMAFGAGVEAMRISVNVGASLGSSGFETNLAPTMTIGTGFVGRSSLGENLEPRHLVQYTRVAYNRDAGVAFDDFAGLQPWTARPTPPAARPAPHDTARPAGASQTPDGRAGRQELDLLREEIRRLVRAELQNALGAHHG
ncbi:aldehyde dehydrogenase family protein [Embleya scabrispora]|uniref:aldehyde dehydrogenase family protein n=1 Tax=Embleya scabrispora TaxID=159449 RepID=UPI000370AB23|nr:aldehyde dehydrogenase family protein [Embleya scabrispora]MYS86652.1 aldehyde dehydrogenase family protein [Streptomyces sp. SID5474]